MSPSHPCKSPITCCATLALALVLSAWCGQIDAHNGKVALAAPVAGIAINGDLSDWPAATRRYPITLYGYGEAPAGDKDLSAWFSLGYDGEEDVLYLAVEVEDDAIRTGEDARE